jgi:hypothetical protein
MTVPARLSDERPYFVPWHAGEGKLAWLPKIDFVRVPQKVLNAVVFLGGRDPNDAAIEQFIGTGFIVVVEEMGIAFPYIVTADHVALKLERAYCPIARLNDADGNGHHYRLRKPARVELEGRTIESVAWYRHPDPVSADVAVTQLTPSEPWLSGPIPFKTLPYVPLSMFVKQSTLHPTQGEVGIGDEVFIPGLFAHAKGREANSPILRVGTLAMLPTEAVNIGTPYGFVDVYLIEAKSTSGISGAPVFVRPSYTVPGKLPRFNDYITSESLTREGLSGRPKTIVYRDEYLLLGVAHGHWDIPDEDTNSPKPALGTGDSHVGIAVVTPMYKILETLNQPALIAQRKDAAKNHTKEGVTTRDSEGFTREDFMRDLGKVVRSTQPRPDAGGASQENTLPRNRRKSGRKKP